MVSLNPDTRLIKLSNKEQLALLQYCTNIPADIHQMIFSAQSGILTLTLPQCDTLRRAVESEIDRISNDEAADTLGILYNKLCTNPVTRKIGEKLNEMSFENIEQMQAATDKIMNQHNNASDPALGGLSPIQAHKLLYTEWGKPDCPLKLNKELGFDDVNKVYLYQNTVILLQELILLEKEITATAKENLARKVVQNLINKFNFDNDFQTKQLIQISNRFNEQEFTAVWKIRLICQMAGLIRKNKNKFLVTKLGKGLLSSENAGKLYNLLFLTYMRKLNIGFSDRLPGLSSLQSTMAYTIYHLGRIAKKEIPLKETYQKIILPAVMEEVEHIELVAKGLIHPSFIIINRVIEPLEYAGLLECKREKVKLFPEIVSLKISPLFQKFIRFEF